MALISPPWAVQNGTHSAKAARQVVDALTRGSAGVVDALSVSPTSPTPDMQVHVSAGTAIVPVTSEAFGGSWAVANDNTVDLTVAAANPVDPRIDVVVLRVRDSALIGGTDNDVIFSIVQGTPAVTPVAPATPANALALANITVAAAATQITSGNINTNIRLYAPGGPVHRYRTGQTVTVQTGRQYYNITSQRWEIAQGSQRIPIGAQLPYVTMQRTSTQVIDNATNEAVVFATPPYENFNEWGFSSAGPVAPYTGTYRVTAMAAWQGGYSAGNTIRMIASPTTLANKYLMQESTSIVDPVFIRSRRVRANAGDTISLLLWQNSGGDRTLLEAELTVELMQVF